MVTKQSPRSVELAARLAGIDAITDAATAS
jgi:hypothetical protein